MQFFKNIYNALGLGNQAQAAPIPAPGTPEHEAYLQMLERKKLEDEDAAMLAVPSQMVTGAK